jgi:hypothetical protein
MTPVTAVVGSYGRTVTAYAATGTKLVSSVKFKVPVFNEARGFGSLIRLPLSPSKPLRPHISIGFAYANGITIFIIAYPTQIYQSHLYILIAALHIALCVLLGKRCALIVKLLALCHSKLHLDAAIFKIES